MPIVTELSIRKKKCISTKKKDCFILLDKITDLYIDKIIDTISIQQSLSTVYNFGGSGYKLQAAYTGVVC